MDALVRPADVTGIDAENDDTLAYLSALKSIVDLGADAPTTAACVQGAARIVVETLAAEHCVICLREPGGTLEPAGTASQSDRFGRIAARSSIDNVLALVRLVGEDAGLQCFARDPEGGLTAVPMERLQGEGCVVVPFLYSEECRGVLLAHWLVAPPFTFGRAAAMRLITGAIGQALTIVVERETRERLVDRLEASLHETRASLATQTDGLQAQRSRIEMLVEEVAIANRVKAEFLANVSHELRTPLNGILGYTALLRDGVAGALSPEQARLLGHALGSAQHLRQLIDDVLFFVHWQGGGVRVDYEVVETQELLDDVLAALPVSEQRPRVPLEVRIAPEAERVITDAALARRIVFHLLANAFKFTRDGRVVLAVAPGDEDGDGIVVSVHDTGVGIARDDVERVFEPFTQADGSSTRAFDGLGIGLTLVQRSAQLLGGTVAVESAVGAGSTFRVTLPRARATTTTRAFTPRVAPGDDRHSAS